MKQALESNKQNAIEFYRTAYLGNPSQALDTYVGAQYIQHNPLVADGKQAFIDYFEQMAKEYPDKDIEFVPISIDQWIDAIKDHPTINPFLSEHLREFSREVSEGRFNDTSNIVKNITGHEPRSFKTYIKEHLELFESISA